MGAKLQFNPFTAELDWIRDDNTTRIAACDASDAVGDIVYATGAGTVARIDIDAANAWPAAGIITRKIDATTCAVQTSGLVSYAGLTAGAPVFVGTDSKPTTTRPAAPTTGKRSIIAIGIAEAASSFRLRLTPTLTRIIP